jgi:hypothetical protein
MNSVISVVRIITSIFDKILIQYTHIFYSQCKKSGGSKLANLTKMNQSWARFDCSPAHGRLCQSLSELQSGGLASGDTKIGQNPLKMYTTYSVKLWWNLWLGLVWKTSSTNRSEWKNVLGDGTVRDTR